VLAALKHRNDAIGRRRVIQKAIHDANALIKAKRALRLGSEIDLGDSALEWVSSGIAAR